MKGSLRIADQFEGKRLLVVGGTGFLGKVWLSMVLLRFPQLEHVYLVCRQRKNRDGSVRLSSEERFWAEVATSPVFDPIRDKKGRGYEAFLKEKITPIPGDVSEDFAGVPQETRDAIRGTVHALVNVAGVVDFQPPLDYALNANAFGMQNLISLVKDLGEGTKMLHTSTCYVAGDRTGQVDEVHPLEYPFPKANELDIDHWSPDREISECLDMVEHVRHRSNDAFRQSEFLDQAKQNLRDKGEPARGSALKDELEKVKRKFVENRLRDDGTERAKFWGWHNTYTYTKSIGEQILCRAGLDFTIVRPAVIESAVAYPRIGWCEGINTSSPLIYLAWKGILLPPTTDESVLDIIPVDMVAAGMILALAELFDGTQEVVYQLGSSDSSPLGMLRLIELVGLTKRRIRLDQGEDGPLLDFIHSRVEPIPMTIEGYRGTFGPMGLSKLAGKAAGVVKAIGGPLTPLTRPAASGLKGLEKNMKITSLILDQFVPFTATHNYRFSCLHARDALGRLDEDERALVPWNPQTIDWRWYISEVHMPGILENVGPEIEKKLKKDPQPLRKHDDLLSFLDELAERHDLAVALQRTEPDGLSRISFRELRLLAHAAAQRLVDAGVNKGDRVLISGDNHPDWPITYFGILRAGGVAVPVDPAMMPEQVANIVDTAQVRVSVVDAKARASFGVALKGKVLALAEVADRGPSDRLPPQDVAPSDVASILFTSGTTGLPKGVMLTHENFTSLLASLGKIFPLRESDRVLSVLPLHHTFEFSCGLLLPLSRGGRVIYLDEVNGERLNYGLREGKVTAMVGVPALWQLLERRIRGQVSERGELFESVFDGGLALNRWLGQATGLDLGKLFFGQVHDRLGGNIRFLISGAAALPKETQELFKGLGLHLAEGYGLTEAAPVLTVAKGAPGTKVGHVGKPIPGVKVKIVEPDKDGVGEIWAKGPNVMQGYYGNEAATSATLEGDWLKTGDLGKIDHKGRLTIMGRAKEVVVTTSGENIYLDDVENALGPNHRYVKEFALVGVPDARGGERLGMLVVPDAEEHADLDRHTLHARAKESIQKAIARLPSFQRPGVLHLVDADLPRTASRKVKRKEVQEVLEKIASAVAQKPKRGESVHAPVARAIAAVAGVDVSQVSMGTELSELGYDSLMWVELASALEALDGGRPDPDELGHCETVQDVVELVKAPKPTVVEVEDPRDTAVEIPGIVAEPARAGLGFLQRELYATGLKCRIYGRAFIPQNRQTIVVSNHTSHLDMGLVKYALGPYGHKLVGLAAKDYFFEGNPWVVAYFEQLTNLRPIDRKRGFRASLNQAADVVREGHVVLIFPEGTRRTDGTLGEFKPLVGQLALETNIDILPLYLDGTFESLPKGATLPRKRDLKVRIGPPLNMRDMKKLCEGLKPADQARRIAMISQRAVEALRDGQVLDLPRCTAEDFPLPGKEVRVVPVERAFGTLEPRYLVDRYKKDQSWYFSLGERRFTVVTDANGAVVKAGKPEGGKADCVVKTSEEMMRRIIEDAYVPEPPEFFSGVIKTNDIPMLIEFSRMFGLSEVKA
jgi:long-chain acyl-CoA synthetase